MTTSSSSSRANRLKDLNKDSKKSLHEAALDGDLALVKHYLTAGADVNARSRVKRLTALHVAALHNHSDVVKLLLARTEARVDARNAAGDTPLHFALRRKFPSLVELLLSHGADPNRTMTNTTEKCCNYRAGRVKPLFVALENEDAESVKTLLDHGAQVDVVNHRNEGPLHVAITVISGESQRYIVCKHLLDKGAPVNHASPRSSLTALYLALELRSDARLAELLVVRGADIHRKGTRRRSPLHQAVEKSFVGLARRLLEAGANPNVPDHAGRSVLWKSVNKSGNQEMVRLLLDYGADCKEDKRSMLSVAVRVSDVSIMQLMLSKGANVNTVADVNKTLRVSVLQYAAYYGRSAIVQCLLENGADVNLEVDGKLPLIYTFHGFGIEFNESLKLSGFLLLKRIALLDAQGKYVHEMNRIFVQEHAVMRDKYDSYRRELESMKSTEVCIESSVTYFDILTKRNHGLVHCLRYEGVRNTISSSNYNTQFPEYANEMELNFRKGLKGLQMIDELQGMLQRVFASVLPCDVTNNISEYFRGNDLEIQLEKQR